MTGYAVYMRYLCWLLWIIGVSVLLVTLLVWTVTPWYSAHQTQGQLAKHVFIVADPETQVVPKPIASLTVRHLQRLLLAHFAGQSESLESDYDADWLVLSAHLTGAQLGLLATLPIWPGWQLQEVDLQPQARLWFLQMRWRTVSQEPIAAVQAMVESGSEANFDARMWRLSDISKGPVVGGLKDQDGVMVEARLVEGFAWRYVGFVRDAQGIGAWLTRSQQVHGTPIFCFVRVGEQCDGLAVLEINEQTLVVQGQKLQRQQGWRLAMAKSGRIADEREH